MSWNTMFTPGSNLISLLVNKSVCAKLVLLVAKHTIVAWFVFIKINPAQSISEWLLLSWCILQLLVLSWCISQCPSETLQILYLWLLLSLESPRLVRRAFWVVFDLSVRQIVFQEKLFQSCDHNFQKTPLFLRAVLLRSGQLTRKNIAGCPSKVFGCVQPPEELPFHMSIWVNTFCKKSGIILP